MAENDSNSDENSLSEVGHKTLQGEYDSDGSYEFETLGISGTCLIPKYYYKGYVASYKNSSGETGELDIEKDEATGLVSINLSGAEETVTIYYGGTSIQMVTRWISILSLVALLISMGISGRIEKYGRKND